MANSIFIKADELAKELDISQGLARYYQEKIYGAGEE